MIVKDLQHIENISVASNVRGRGFGNFSFNSTSLSEPQPLSRSFNLFSLAENPEHPLIWRLPDLTFERVTPTW